VAKYTDMNGAMLMEGAGPESFRRQKGG